MTVIQTLKTSYWQLCKLNRDLRWRIRANHALAGGANTAHFLHINKCAGSAVKEALFNHRVTPAYVLRLHTHKTILRDIPVGDKFFFLLRDPITRFISGFNHCMNKGHPKYFIEWSEAEAKAFDLFRSAESLALSLSSKDAERRELADFAMRNISHVRTSFYDWFESDEYFDSRRDDLLFIGFQETLERDFNYLAKLLGLPDGTGLPCDGVMSNKSSTIANQHERAAYRLSAQAIDNLNDWFSRDLHFYRKCTALASQLWLTDKKLSLAE